MEIFPKVAKNTLYQVLGRVGVALTSLSVTAVLTRQLGTGGYGNYVFVISLILYFVAISDWGTGLISVREASKERKKEEKFYGNALLLRILSSLLSLLVVNLLVFLPFFQNLAIPIRLASLLLILISLKTSSHIVFQVKLRFEYIALVDVVISFVFLVLLGFLIKFFHLFLDLQLVILLFVMANFWGGLLALFLATRLSSFNFQLDKRLLRRILTESISTGALLFTFSVYNRLDVILLQAFKGADSVGLYGLAYKVHDNLILGAAYLMAALFPVLSNLTSQVESREKLKITFQKTFDLLFLSALALLVGVLIFAPLVISLLGGEGFKESVSILRILVFATFLSYFNHLTGYTLIALGRQRVSFFFALVALFWNLSLNLIFIPRYSYFGAAGVTIATEGLVLILTSFYLARSFNLRPSFSFPKTLVEIIKTRGKIF